MKNILSLKAYLKARKFVPSEHCDGDCEDCDYSDDCEEYEEGGHN